MKSTKRNLAGAQVFFLTLAMILGFSPATTVAAGNPTLAVQPKQIHFNSKKLCGESRYSTIVAGGALLGGTALGAKIGAGAGASIGSILGLACDVASANPTFTCTILSTKIGTVVGAGVGGAISAVVGHMSWNAIFGHHNCAAAIYTYELNGYKKFSRAKNSESIRAAQRASERRIKKLGGSNIRLETSFDGWETRCAYFGWGKDGTAYTALGPSISRARNRFNKLCKEGNTECSYYDSFCNNWKWFQWDHWSF